MKNCPWCNGKEFKFFFGVLRKDGTRRGKVICRTCGASGPSENDATKATLMEQWNLRVTGYAAPHRTA
jgi:Lar family restriction alleviation protein